MIDTNLSEEALERQDFKDNIDELQFLVKEYRSTEHFKKMLDFIVKCNWLAPYNAMLVEMQLPGAYMVLNAKDWAKFNRRPKLNARNLVTLMQRDYSLVGRPSEAQGCVALCFNERAIDKHVDQFEQGCYVGMVSNFFIREPGVTPDGLSERLDFAGKRQDFFGLIQRIASRERYIEVGFTDYLHQFVDRHVMPGIEIPSRRVVTSGTSMTASGKIDGCAKASAVDTGSFDNIHYAHHLWITRSLSSASLLLFQRSVVPTR